MRKLILVLLISCNLLCISNSDTEKNRTLCLQKAKENWSLTIPFLQNMAQLFPVDYFIETGTYLGNTAILASTIFKQVHTIELSQELFEQTKVRFENHENIFAYNGDSDSILDIVLAKLKGAKLIWLDAHYSPNSAYRTALGHSITPIIEELEAIKKNDRQAIIMIDDVRIFCESKPRKIHWQGYPTIKEVYNKLKEINTDYECAIMGDILFAFPKHLDITLSPIIKACTESYLFGEDFDGEKAIEAEKIIAHDNDSKDMIEYYSNYLNTPYCHLWYGLSLLHSQKSEQALMLFEEAIKNGFKHWRVNWYRAQAFLSLEKYAEALNELDMLLQRAPNFSKAQDLLCSIRTMQNSQLRVILAEHDLE
jgi:hypothetical protein